MVKVAKIEGHSPRSQFEEAGIIGAVQGYFHYSQSLNSMWRKSNYA